MGWLRRTFLALVALLGTAGAMASEVPPRVCLVLSGGGALGVAHIGVLKVLEELRVPLHCIAGTSMGAIVGGLYAAGYSPAELERVTRELDWRELLNDQPERRSLPYRRKIDDLTYLSRWELGLSEGRLKMPSGMLSGHKLGVTLRLLALRALDVDDFDRLPVRFRALAADIVNGETVVLASGSLAEALRASMAVPGLFSPVEIDGRLLVDGGVVANLPVASAREMGADVIIAVDLGQPLAEGSRPDSIAGMITRTQDFLTRLNVERALADVDVLIRPAVREWGLLDFHEARRIVPQGEQAAREQAPALSGLSVGEQEWASYLATQRRTTPPIRLASVELDPATGVDARRAAGAIKTGAGRDLDPAVLAADIDRLYDLGEFETVDFVLTRQHDGHTLRLTGRRKSWGPNYLRFGVSLASDLEGASQFNVLAALTLTRLNRWGAEVKTAAQAGETPFGSAELYQPLGGSGIPFVSFGVQGAQTKVQVAVDEEPMQYRFWLQRAAFDLGLALGRYGEVRAGLRHDTVTGRASGRPELEPPREPPRYDVSEAAWRVALAFDQVDNVNFPREGVLALAEISSSLPSLAGELEYRRADLQLVGAFSHGRHSLVGLLHGSSALGGELPPSGRLSLGGLFNLSGVPPGEVTGSYGGVAAMLYLYRIRRLPAFGDSLYAGLSLEAGNAWERADQVHVSDLRHSAALLFGVDTRLGPVYLAHGVSSGGKDSFYLFVGRTF